VIRKIHLPEHIIKSLKSKKKLSKSVKEKFYWCLDMLVEDSKYPSLRNKTVKGTTDIWEFSINKNYRCVYRKEKEEIFILAIAVHEDVF
jgi:mRNA-degrading endonuclease YafQ of YafQ-DinJ toxin-antitoxin module